MENASETHRHFPMEGYTVWHRLFNVIPSLKRALCGRACICSGCKTAIMPKSIVGVIALGSFLFAEVSGCTVYYAFFKNGCAWITATLIGVAVSLIMNIVIPGILLSTIPWEKADKKKTRALEFEDEEDLRGDWRIYISFKILLFALYPR